MPDPLPYLFGVRRGREGHEDLARETIRVGEENLLDFELAIDSPVPHIRNVCTIYIFITRGGSTHLWLGGGGKILEIGTLL